VAAEGNGPRDAQARFAPRSSPAAASHSRPSPRSYDVKVNKKVRRAALRAALSAHAGERTLGVVPDDVFDGPRPARQASCSEPGARTSHSW
jgi:ribosomal protein L4